MFLNKALKLTENVLTSIDKKASELNKRNVSDSRFKNSTPGVITTFGNTQNEDDNKTSVEPTSKKSEKSNVNLLFKPPVRDHEGGKGKQFSREREKDLEQQIEKLLSEKLESNNKFTKSLEEKEKNFSNILARLSQKDTLIQTLQNEKNSISEKHSLKIKELTNEVLEVRKKLTERERERETEKEQVESEKQEHLLKVRELQKEVSDVEKDYMKLQTELQTQKKEMKRIKEMHVLKQRDWDDKENENNQYKIRVQNIIREKNKEILEKKDQNQTEKNVGGDLNVESETDFQFEIENLKNEIKEATVKLKMEKRERENMQIEFTNYKKTTNRHMAIKEEEIQEKLLVIRDLKKNQMEKMRIDLENTKKKSKRIIKEKDDQIFALRKSINELQNEQGWEKKLRNLSESVIQKEERIQTLMSEKLALNLRLEKEANKYQELNDTNFVEKRRRNGDTIIELPSIPVTSKKFFADANQNPVKRLLKKLVTKIDNLGIDTIKYLKTNSNLRFYAVLYFLIFHLIFVLVFFKAYF